MAKQAAKETENRFRSRSEHSLDDKSRLNIPSRFREVLQSDNSDRLMVTGWHKCLKAYPVSAWLAMENKLLEQGKLQRGMAAFVRYVISGVTECGLDKQGRILLPAALRGDFNIQKEVMLNGMLDHFEIWDKAAWESETRQTRENFRDFEESLSVLGIL